MTEKVKAAMQYIRRVQRTEPQKWINNDSVPIDLEGSMEIPSIPERKYVVEYLEEKHVENEVLYAHLFDHLCNFLEVL